MRVQRSLTLLSLSLAYAAGAARAQSPMISEPVAELPVRSGLEPSMPVGVGSHTMTFRYLSTSSSAPYATTFKTDGSVDRDFVAQIPGAAEFMSTSVVAFADGSGYALAGVAIVDGQRQAVLCFLDAAGHYRSSRPTHFWIGQLAEAADGTLWAFGETHQGDQTVLRRYSRQGEQLESLVPRSAFPPGRETPAMNSLTQGVPGGVAQLAVTNSRVLLFSPAYYRVCEVELATRRYSCFDVPPPVPTAPSAAAQPTSQTSSAGTPACKSEEALLSLAMTSDNAVYATFAGSAFGPFELDRHSRRWVPIPEDLWHRESLNLILGARGDRIVYRSKQLAHFWEVRQIKLQPRMDTSFVPNSAQASVR
jgi:hypothetical protein